jgi:pimeloyl-ACP methyl ester carboxylesterase
MFFEGFALTEVAVPGGTIRLRQGGSGPPLLLLHGNPQTHAMWCDLSRPARLWLLAEAALDGRSLAIFEAGNGEGHDCCHWITSAIVVSC